MDSENILNNVDIFIDSVVQIMFLVNDSRMNIIFLWTMLWQELHPYFQVSAKYMFH